MLAGEIDGVALQQVAPDGKELVRCFVALIVIEVDAFGSQLGSIAAGHHVEQ
ncbi:hypothetical protein D3C81_2027870 [compost metagenome]